jgi:hypothetical protein
MWLALNIALGILLGYFLIRHYSIFYAPFQVFISDFLFWIIICMGAASIFSITLYFEWIYLWPVISREEGVSFWIVLFFSAYISLGLPVLLCSLYIMITRKLFDALRFNVARKDDPFNLKNV